MQRSRILHGDRDQHRAIWKPDADQQQRHDQRLGNNDKSAIRNIAHGLCHFRSIRIAQLNHEQRDDFGHYDNPGEQHPISIAIDLADSTQAVTIDNSGTITGDVYLGTGNDQVTIQGSATTPASLDGNLFLGGTGDGNGTAGVDTLTIGPFGTLTGAVVEKLGSLVDVFVDQGGTLDLENTPQNLGDSNVVGLYADHFEVSSGANLDVVLSQQFNLTVNPQTGALINSQFASIGNNTPIGISFGSYVGDFVPGRGLQGGNKTAVFDLLSAPLGQLDISGSEITQVNNAFKTTIPFLFTGDLCTWNVNGGSTCTGANPGISELDLDLTPKSPQTLGLTGYALKMFPYANKSLVFDNLLGGAMLNDITNAQQAQDAYAAFAPDVSGATRALAISLTDDATNVVAARQRVLREYANQDGDLTMWTQEFVERLNQDNTVDGSAIPTPASASCSAPTKATRPTAAMAAPSHSFRVV